MTRVACIGEAMVEVALTSAAAAQVGVAGDTLNTAIYLKRCAPELHVDYITKLGDDPFSDRIAAFIASEEIGTDAIAREAGGSPGLYAITTDAQGERTFTYWRSDAAARRLFDDGDFSVLQDYDLLYMSGISLAILPHNVRLRLLTYISENGLRLAYDSNHRPRLWEDEATARTVNRQAWRAARIALPSRDDEMALHGQSAQDVEARFLELGTQGALKRGEAGPLSLGADQVEQSYPEAPTVIDTTAAGDSFNGGYLAAHLTGATQAQALLAGHSLAAQVVGQRGAIISPPAT